MTSRLFRALPVATAVLLGAIFPAQAQSLSFYSLPDGQNKVPIIYLSTMISKDGELKEDFIKRAASNMAAFTEKSGKEACSTIYKSQNGKTALYITTSNSQLGCVYTINPPEGFSKTEETLHTHPKARSSALTSDDRKFLMYQEREETIVHFTPDHFSPFDEEIGPGYLAVDDTLHYQKDGILAPSVPLSRGDDEVAQSWVNVLEETVKQYKRKR